ncbi:DUF4397 domain-containing protein [Rhizobacter sp. OV335]|uniref:DUF4397 domain-containing protein n=1 Tax=Rhizobacter sp. OV335 TaxID=1500264 RepID=UPI00091E568D|nr:DUF4397 domain-containing protein [Rhizobacter sp. OV335]SHM64290.1 protein of unknown function [Rhizobacter sp. OV335]
MKSPTRALLIAALVLPLLHACGGNSDEDEGSVRLINATTDFALLDASRDDDGMVYGVAAGTSSGYAHLDKDSYTFKIAQSGSGTVAASIGGSVSAGSHYALLAYASGASLQVSYLTEDEGEPNSGQAKLRFMNTAGLEAGNLDVYVGHVACNALGATAIAAASGLSTSTSATAPTGYTAFGAGSYHVCVTAAGGKNDVRLDIPALTLGDKQVATLVLTRSSGGMLVNGLVVSQQGAVTPSANLSTRVRVVANTLVSTDMVNVAVNGTTVASNSSPGTVGGYRLVTAGALAVTVNGAAVNVGAATAPSGGDLTLLVTGDVSAPQVSVITDDNTPSTSASEPVKLRLVNGVNGLTGSANATLDSEVIGDDVAFGAASLPATVAASAGLADLAASNGASLLWQLKDQTLTTGKVYSIFLLGNTTTVGTASTLRADR